MDFFPQSSVFFIQNPDPSKLIFSISYSMSCFKFMFNFLFFTLDDYFYMCVVSLGGLVLQMFFLSSFSWHNIIHEFCTQFTNCFIAAYILYHSHRMWCTEMCEPATALSSSLAVMKWKTRSINLRAFSSVERQKPRGRCGFPPHKHAVPHAAV